MTILKMLVSTTVVTFLLLVGLTDTGIRTAPIDPLPNIFNPDTTINGTGGNDTIKGTDQPDTLNGRGGNDTIDGGIGNDVIDGGPGRDTIDGGVGNDQINGGQGNDTIDGNDGNDRIDGGAGNDTARGGAGNDRIDGGQGDDKINGGADADTLNGGTGKDRIRGGSGDDTIDGGGGNDRIVAGTGNDTYRVVDNDGNDRIVIRAGDVEDEQTENVRCGSGRDLVKFIGVSRNDRIGATRQFRDPDTGGIYDIATDCEQVRFNDELAFLDANAIPGTTVGLPGAVVALTGTDFPPLDTITVALGETTVATFMTGDFGDFETSFEVPDTTFGTYPLTFANAGLEFAFTTFFTVGGGGAAGGKGTLWIAGAIVLAGLLIALALFRKKRREPEGEPGESGGPGEPV